MRRPKWDVIYLRNQSVQILFRDHSNSLIKYCLIPNLYVRWKFENIFFQNTSTLTETTVLLFSAVDGSICLELQMKALSTVQLRYDPLQLGLCKETEGREREKNRQG